MDKFSLDIVFVVPGMAFSGGSLARHSLGGSETAAVYMAKEFAKMGHVVTVFSDCSSQHTGGPGDHDGVSYRPIEGAASWIRSCEHDVLIVERNSTFFGIESRSKLNILWNHDLAVKQGRAQILSVLWNLDYITGLSKFHVEQQKRIAHIPESLMWQTRNGIDFDSFAFSLEEKNSRQLIYTSRPERGLENLVKPGGIMEALYKLDPEIKLVVAGYDHTTEQMRAYYEYLWKRIEQLPNCENVGPLPKHRLYKLFAESGVYVYPSDFEEISFITAMECMRSKVAIVATNKGATPETVKDGAILLDGPANTDEYRDRFVESVLDLTGNHEKRIELTSKAYDYTSNMSWASVAQEWEVKFLEFFAKQTENKKRLQGHFRFNGDVIACSKVIDNDVLVDRSVKANSKARHFYNNIFTDNEFQISSDENLKTIFLDAHIQKPEVRNVLIYGYDVEQYVFSLAKKYPDKTFCVADISDKKIDKLLEIKDLLNVKFAAFNPDHFLAQDFDCVACCGILEMQADPMFFINTMEMSGGHNSALLFITSNGPWGKIDDKSKRMFRLWNFDRHDLRDLFSKKKGYAINTGQASETITSGDCLSWYFTSYIKDPRPTGKINLKRKLAIQRPRPTLALSMIVKNSEGMLHRTLKSVDGLVDEMVIVDTGSTDSTKKIAKQYTNKVYDGSDPVVHGFETPRNETLQYIGSDWILWIDSDEVLLRGQNLRKYLRDNCYNGYAVRQHHFSAVPPNAFNPDLPIRLFRTDKNIKWFGQVHEHVEIEINKSVESSMLISDVDIGHDGYLTEDIRRERFSRNYRLLLQDREKYPDRRLGRFLKARDDIHVVRYLLEENRMQVTAEILKKCEDIVIDVRENFLFTNDHMQMDALSFYSEALRVLNKGFTLTWNISCAKNNVSTDSKDINNYIFENTKDVEGFFASKFKNMFELYEGDYSV